MHHHVKILFRQTKKRVVETSQYTQNMCLTLEAVSCILFEIVHCRLGEHTGFAGMLNADNCSSNK
jgi:hypothetical protein